MNQLTADQDIFGINDEKYLLKSTQLANNRTQSKMTSISSLKTTLQSSSIFNSTYSNSFQQWSGKFFGFFLEWRVFKYHFYLMRQCT